MSEARAPLPPDAAPPSAAGRLVSGLRPFDLPPQPSSTALANGAVAAPAPTPAPNGADAAPSYSGPQSTVNFWLTKGVPLHVAQGIADQTVKESGGDPLRLGDGGTSVGLYQHHGQRMRDVMARVENEQAFKEVTGGDPTATAHWNEIKSAPTRQEASRLWQQYFERPAGTRDATGHVAAERVRQESYDAAGRLHGEARELMKQTGDYTRNIDQSLQRIRAAQDKADEANQAMLKAIQHPPQQPDINGLQHFGGLATIVGILGGLLTRRPLQGSLNAAASAMEAHNQGDLDRYKLARDNWKMNVDLLKTTAEINTTRIREIIDDEKLGLEGRRNLMDVTLRAIGLDRLADEARIHGDEKVLDYISTSERAQATLDKQYKMLDERARIQEDMLERKGWQIVTDPTQKDEQGNPVQYRYNANTGEATTLDKKPYAPGGAQKLTAKNSSSPLSDAAANRYAKIFESSGYLPPGIARSGAAIAQIMNKTGDTGTPGDFVANLATKQADTRSLANMTKMADAATSFENTAIRNFDQALTYADAAIPTDWGPWLNRWVERGETMAGDPKVPAYVTALITAANEYAKVMGGSTGAQGSTVDARREAAELFSPYLAKGQIKEVVKVAKAEMENRREELYSGVDDIRNRLRQAGSNAPMSRGHEPGATSGATPGATPGASSGAVSAQPALTYVPGMTRTFNGKTYTLGDGDPTDKNSWQETPAASAPLPP